MEICVSGLFLGLGALSDFKKQKIPYGLLLPALAAAVLIAIVRGEGVQAIVFRMLPACFCWILRILTKKGIGMGDVLAVVILSLLVGPGQTLLILTGAALLSLCGFGIRKLRKKEETEGMPFYPALFLSWGVFLAGNYLGIATEGLSGVAAWI